MADKPEMELGLASDCKWVRALDADGNSIRIEKSVLVELIRSEMPVATNGKGLADSNFFSSHKGSVHIESWGDLSGLNFTFSPGSYTVRTGDSSIWGHLIVFYTGNPALHGNIIQFLIRPSDDWFLKVRVSTSANLEITSEWKSFFLRDLYRRTKSLILVHIPRPKKVRDMADKEEKELNVSSIADYLRALKDGISVNISPDDLLNQVGGLIEHQFSINDDLNVIFKSGVYYSNITATVDSLKHKPQYGGIGEAVLLSLNGGRNLFSVQLYFNITAQLSFVRFCYAGEWTDWKSIFTT